MKCPKCGVSLLDHVDVCPFCKTPIDKTVDDKMTDNTEKPVVSQNTGRYSAIDPSRDSYDFDLQYTLTFRDSGEIKQAIEDMDAGIARESSKKKISAGGRETDEPRYSLEEMQEAALRAQQRRERKNGGRPSSRDNKRTTRTQKKIKNALNRAKDIGSLPDGENHSRNKSSKRSSKKRLFMGICVLAVVIALIIGIVSICSFVSKKAPEIPIVYTQNNTLHSYYKNKDVEISSNFITTPYEEKTSSMDSLSVSDKKQTPVDVKVGENKIMTNKELVSVSENGTYMFFFENVNMNTKMGTLVFYQNGKKKSRTVVAQNVFCKPEIGKDGTRILYVKNTDGDGAGELCYWSYDKKEERSIDTGVRAGNFKLAQDSSSVTYIRNFNPIVYTGDLYYASLTDKNVSARRVDEKVSFVFGTSAKGKTYFYAKNYEVKDGTYDLFIQSDTEGPRSVAEKGYNAPVISKKENTAFIFGNTKNKLQTLNCLDLDTGSNIKLSDDVTDIVKVRKDEGAIIFSRNFDTKKADYYLVNAKSPNPQTVARDINLEVISNGGQVLFDASDDFSKIAYIGGFDSASVKGSLYTLSVVNEYAGSEARISDDAYSCDVSSDGGVIRFASGYNAETKTVKLISYSNSNTLSLAESVGVGAFTFDEHGEYSLYAKNIDSNSSGCIESVNKKAKIKKIVDTASAYGLRKDNSVIILKTTTEGDKQLTTLYKTSINGGKLKLVADNVDASGILSYK